MWVQTYRSNVTPWDDTGSTDEGGANVGNDGTIKVRHDHNVKLLRFGDQLHGTIGNDVRIGMRGVAAQNLRVINDHVVVSDSGGLVLLGNATEGVKEQTIAEFHDVGLVYASNFLWREMSGHWTEQRWKKSSPCGCSSRRNRRQIEQCARPWHESRFSNSRRHREYSGAQGQSTLLRYFHE